MKALLSRHRLALLLLAAVFIVVDTWGHVTGAYPTVFWVDIVTHLTFGTWLGLLLLYPGLFPRMQPLLVVALVLAVGAGWEVVEYARDTWYAAPRDIPLAQHGWSDTLKDTFNNAVGAGAAVIARKYL